MEGKLRRKYLGKIFLTSTAPLAERRFEEKHLKAYLKGKEYFTFGRTPEGDKAAYVVKQEFYEEKE